ncbi:MAG: cupin domain-containing protein [Curvibacter lanceolatus]|uniref:cupin domain-containing protein n=1 Tax=Curvibacter lanceolatus TaxID=86182 RepID=UPI00036DEE72|nr:cupin domain-containing protein [Curvibacter lanceolatus]MBV5294944.1 cupin domain-containing protein [Curvibacter lanceolatus]
MPTSDLHQLAAALPQPWRSHIVARLGHSQLKVLRMDGQPAEDETHPYDEAFVVLAGELRLVVAGQALRVQAGELYTVAAGIPHAVAAGSWGTLLIIDPAA